MTNDELKEYQTRMGLTNRQMAKLLCCSISHLEHLRAGTRKIRPVYARIIQQACRK